MQRQGGGTNDVQRRENKNKKQKTNIIHLKTTETKVSGAVSTVLKWIEMANNVKCRKCKTNTNSYNIDTNGGNSSNNNKGENYEATNTKRQKQKTNSH